MFMLHIWKKFISLLISSAAYHFSNPETRLNPALWSVLLHSCKAPLMSQGDCLEKAIYFVFPGWRHPNKIKLIPLRIVKHQLLHTQNQKQGLLFTGHRPAFKITELSVNTFSLFHLLEQTNNTSDIFSMTVTHVVYLNDRQSPFLRNHLSITLFPVTGKSNYYFNSRANCNDSRQSSPLCVRLWYCMSVTNGSGMLN